MRTVHLAWVTVLSLAPLAVAPPTSAMPALAQPALIQSDDAVDARLSSDYDDCMDAADTTTDMQACVKAEFADQDADLNSAYRDLLADSDPGPAAAFRRSQRAWLAVRDSDCIAESGGGTQGRVDASICVLRKTVARTLWLEARASD
ncbi:lysozyme inhibitor LprI family protein [soil metagenome]